MMSWSAELWDQFDNVALHTQKGIEFCEKILSFMKDRCAIEQEYANKLKRLVKNCLPKAERSDKKKDEDEFTAVKGFHLMIREIHDLAGQRETVVEKLTDGPMKDLQNILQDVRSERKKFVADGNKYQAAYQNQMQQYERVKRQNDRMHKELERAQDAQMKTEQDSHVPRIDVEKLKQTVVLKQQAYDESKSELVAEVAKTRGVMNEHFQNNMPHIFQALDEKRISNVQSFIRQTAEIERQVLSVSTRCIEGIEEAADSVNCKADSQKVVDRFFTGLLPPSDVGFDDSSVGKTPATSKGDSTKNVATGKRRTFFHLLRAPKPDEVKDDFSHLPPGQQKKQLKAKIDGLKADLNKENAERDGIQKLRDAYLRNPKLGDAATVNKQLEESSQKMNQLQHEICRFEAYLAATEAAVNADTTPGSAPSSSTPPRKSVIQPASAAANQTEEQNTVDGVLVKKAMSVTEQDSFDEDDDGSCVALYAFQATSEGTLAMYEGEQFSVVERDHGDGWTQVRNSQGEVGYVPSSYIECHFDI